MPDLVDLLARRHRGVERHRQETEPSVLAHGPPGEVEAPASVSGEPPREVEGMIGPFQRVSLDPAKQIVLLGRPGNALDLMHRCTCQSVARPGTDHGSMIA